MRLCSKDVAAIVFGMIFVFIGFIMTVYGNAAKPFYSASHSSWCDDCKEDTDTTQRNIDNCKIAGPIFLALGFVLIVVGFCTKKKFLNDQIMLGNQAIASTGAHVVNYSSSGNVKINTPRNPYQQTQPQYPTQQYPPPPLQQQFPLPPHQQYPPAPQQPYPPPPQGQYPPPPQRQYPPPPPHQQHSLPVQEQHPTLPQYVHQPLNGPEPYPGNFHVVTLIV